MTYSYVYSSVHNPGYVVFRMLDSPDVTFNTEEFYGTDAVEETKRKLVK